ncbi:MAG TPA: prepilin-type N-terminal cleavage/methylation domain-containing protein, partial [Sedimentisphaerales bacterium]|nr:prepilin-type N-terminal cleavage/methylation domain-containing protein [Sedimentisphaerales bacterium]
MAASTMTKQSSRTAQCPIPDVHRSRLAARGFTLVEVLIAVAILAITLGAMGVIFRMSLEAYRASSATTEIMRKLRAITEQINADFRGLRKDGLIFLVWSVSDPDPDRTDPHLLDDRPRYSREDRIIFFANGDFQTHNQQETTTAGTKKTVRGNVARIQYMIARDKDNNWPESFGAAGMGLPQHRAQREQRRRTRILARSQHIVTADPAFPKFPDFDGIEGLGTFDQALYQQMNNRLEYDTDGLFGWTNAFVEPYGLGPPYGLFAFLSACTGLEIAGNAMYDGGLRIDPDAADAAGVHLTFIQGIRDF